MIHDSPNAGTAENPAAESRLERRRQRRKVATSVRLDPAVKRACRAVIRRQHYGDLTGIIERLLVLWLRSKKGQRGHMVSFGFYEPHKSHAGNAETLAESMQEYQELQQHAAPRQGIMHDGYLLLRGNRDGGCCHVDLGTMQVLIGDDCNFRVFWDTLAEADRRLSHR